MTKNNFISPYKLFTFSKDSNFVSTFGHVEKQLDQKNKISFKIHGVTTWLTSNYDAHIAKYLT